MLLVDFRWEDVRPEVVAAAEADLEVDRLGLDALVLEDLKRVVVDVGAALDALGDRIEVKEGERSAQRQLACEGGK